MMIETKIKKLSENTLSDVVNIVYLNSDNAEFTEKSGFISLRMTFDGVEHEYERVLLNRAFPFELTEQFICVTDKEGNEIGIIKDVSDLSSEQTQILRRELKRKYFIFKITKINDIKDRYGFSYWDVEGADGKMSFTLQDTYRSITRINSDRLILTDVDGNKYEIESLKSLDRKSSKKIELYI